MQSIDTIVSNTASKVIDLAKIRLNDAIHSKGDNCKIGFGGTAYYLPISYALLGLEVKTLKDAKNILVSSRKLLSGMPLENGLSVSALGGVLHKSLSIILAEELLTALSDEKYDGYSGFIADTVLRSLGVQLVDGRIAGIAVIIGKAKDSAVALKIIRGFQERNIVSFLVGNKDEKNIRDQLVEKDVELGLDNYIVPLGSDELSAIFALNFAIRAALTFGGYKGGQWKEILQYAQNRVNAFVLVLGKLDELITTTGLGVLNFGFPIITDMDAPEIGKIDTTRYEALIVEKDYEKIVSRCIEARGIKAKVTSLPIPVLYGPAFEGERVRRENVKAEFGGKYSHAFEYLRYRPMEEISDGKIELIGPDVGEGNAIVLPLGILIEVSSRNFNKDFEPILERQLHKYLNEAKGIMHMGQRDMEWIRISQEAYNNGFRLKHFGTIIYAMLHKEFGAIIDKVQISIFTQEKDVNEYMKVARSSFEARDARLKGMTDEAVDTFYSCALCQSFAPNHICIVTPERLGLCGAYSWLDAKAAYEITPSGGNQPIEKGECLNENLGQWKNINDFIFEKSNKTISEVSMYSLLISPQSSCGCFECIVALLPEVNGVMIVSRDYAGATPSGMNFTELAGSVGGGVQTPGFLGIGRLYISSKKFISAEGGLARIVWMPKDLKEALKDKIDARAQELGLKDFYNKIADEATAQTIEALTEFLNAKQHPAYTMPGLI